MTKFSFASPKTSGKCAASIYPGGCQSKRHRSADWFPALAILAAAATAASAQGNTLRPGSTVTTVTSVINL